MVTTPIRIRRSDKSAPPPSLTPGELAWAEGSGTLYIGLLAGGMLAIAGNSYKQNQPITVTGDATGSGTTAIALTLKDVVTPGTAPKLTFNAKGLVVGSGNLTEGDIPALPIAKVTGLQAALNNTATLDATGKLPTSLLPPLSTTEVYTVNSQAAMLALNAQRGDVAVRSDVRLNYILGGEDPTVLANWVEFLTPNSSAGGIVTVNGISGSNGVLTLTGANIPTSAVGNIAATNIQAAIAELDSEKLAVNQSLTFAGDAAGSGAANSTISLTLANVVTAGTSPKVTFDAKGRVTGGGSLVEADIPVLAITKITGLQAALDSKINVTDVIDGGTW